jgi:SOS response regulatory protein OraA/RecX
VPVDAERWLASRGIRREPLQIDPVAGIDAAPALAPEVVDVPAPAREAESEASRSSDPGEGLDDRSEDRGLTLGGALGFIRRSTTNAPQSEGRLRMKLADRGYTSDMIEEALARARAERIVDDAAMLAALIAERRSRGHADLRLRRDLRGRGFTGPQVDEALARHAVTDQAAAVFALARDQAVRHRGVDAEAAVRRTVGFLVRRGHGEGLARKAARDAVYADREGQRVAER